MSHSDSSFSWQYPTMGPAPPTPVAVNTFPAYVGGRPTPPPTPPRVRATRTVDDYAPCPPTPLCVPSSLDEDGLGYLIKLASAISRSAFYNCWSVSDLDLSTCFASPLTVSASDNSDDQDPYDVTPHVSDCLIYAREDYAYPSPVLGIIKRAELDLEGLTTRPVNPRACGPPLKLFSLTAGITPATGLRMCDEQSFDYYSSVPPAGPEGVPPNRFSIGTIQALQHELRTRWHCVYPQPIPPVIVRLHDLVGPHALNPRGDGYAYVVPAEDSIWDTVGNRGVDWDFRPLDTSTTVLTDMARVGAALYHPQHIVASQFAVNVFLEIPDSGGQAPTPLCEYLGAYVLQVVGSLTLEDAFWRGIDAKVQRSVFDRVPHVFDTPKNDEKPWLALPSLPHVRFCYYKWDACLLGLADEFRNRYVLAASRVDEHNAENESVYSDNSSPFSWFDSDRDSDVDQDAISTPGEYSPEREYTSLLDFSSSE